MKVKRTLHAVVPEMREALAMPQSARAATRRNRRTRGAYSANTVTRRDLLEMRKK